jgi:hypothetical protein
MVKNTRTQEENSFEEEPEVRPPRRHRPRDEELEDEPKQRVSPRRPVRRKPARKRSSVALIASLAVGGGLLLIALIVGAIVVVRHFGNAYEKHEALSKEMIHGLNELAKALESVKDPESAKRAAVRVEKVCDQMEEIEWRAKALPKITKADDERLRQQFEPDFQKTQARLNKVAFQAGVNSKGEPTFVAALKRLETVGRGLQSLGK